MTDREGNTNASRVEEREARTGHSSGNAPLEEDRGTSWVSVVSGWFAALGAGLILSGIVSGIVGAIFGTAGRQGIAEGGTTALIGLLITLFLAFLIGGYAAGRLASRSGLKHGLLVLLLALVVTIVLAIVGGLLGELHRSALRRYAAPGRADRPASRPQSIGTILDGLGHPRALVPFIGGAIGGAWGARTGRRRPRVSRVNEKKPIGRSNIDG